MNNEIDKECVKLCQAMNLMPGVRTVESCCGHQHKPYQVWFKVKRLTYLPKLIYYFDGCHCGYYGWSITVKTDCSMSPAVFCVNGPIGDSAYRESEEIAELLMEHLRHENIL